MLVKTMQRAVAGVALLGLLLSGCGSTNEPSTTGSAAVAESRNEGLVPPSNPDDIVAWRAFVGQAILIQTRDQKLHPYAYVVPAGDAADAVEQRDSEAMAIHSMLGRTALPGGLIALTGPDSTKVAEVIVKAFKGVDNHAARGLAVLYIGVPDKAIQAEAAVKASGAELRLQPMRVP